VGVVIHSTRGNASTRQLEYTATISWFQNPSSGVSAHRVIGYFPGQHAQLVPDHLIAWHARTYNAHWLGVELVQPKPTDDFSRWQYEELARLYLSWARANGFPADGYHIVGHDEIPPGIADGKTDPGALFDWELLKALLATGWRE